MEFGNAGSLWKYRYQVSGLGDVLETIVIMLFISIILNNILINFGICSRVELLAILAKDLYIIGAAMFNQQEQCSSIKIKQIEDYDPYMAFDLHSFENHLDHSALEYLQNNEKFMVAARRLVFV
jgi:hypothetical protein